MCVRRDGYFNFLNTERDNNVPLFPPTGQRAETGGD